MDALTVLFPKPGQVRLERLRLPESTDSDIVIEVSHSGISTGTERLLYTGRMPAFPGLSWPLVPGYESVGTVVRSGADAQHKVGDWVFVPGGKGFDGAAAVFGGAASHIVSAAARAVAIPRSLGAQGILFALAATAYHVLAGGRDSHPELIVGHGVFGRLLARLVIALDGVPPIVWETQAARRSGALGYPVIDPADDHNHSYRRICDASGDVGLIDLLIGRLARNGEIVLAGFYDKPVQFAFPPAFMREARLRISAEWLPADLEAVTGLVDSGALSLEGLITHRRPVEMAAVAYEQAFSDPDCLKMVLDWSPAENTGDKA